ncbi:MAG: SDR family NAD(P)-dependent oxidoreductase [Myxococcota bacterium]
MAEDYALRTTERPSTRGLARLVAGLRGQRARVAWCPETPRLDGAVALVSGGSRGIGWATSLGLAARGAEVVSASRGREAGHRLTEAIAARSWAPAHAVELDLSAPDSIAAALDALEKILAGRRLDVLVANAGLWPSRYGTSAEGFEIAFATNVLGHHRLLAGARARGLLADGARVVIVTGDIYILSGECTPDYRYRGALGGQLAYCRSKLGNLWYARELARRDATLRVHAVHPGVIASELAGPNVGWIGRIKRAVLLSIEEGAQTSLFCATQPGLASGTYYHNVLGRMELAPSDPAADDARAGALWEWLEAVDA